MKTFQHLPTGVLLLVLITLSSACLPSCRFKLCRPGKVSLHDESDVALTSPICLWKRRIGVVNTGEALVQRSGGRFRFISRINPKGLKQRYSPSFFKAYPLKHIAGKPSRGSGVGHEVPQQNQKEFLGGRCVALPIREFQKLVGRNHVENIRLRRHPTVNCVSFMIARKRRPTGPIMIPSKSPTALPSETLDEPTAEPVMEPSFAPVMEPSFEPVMEPSFEPVMEPSFAPVMEPSFEPVMEPTEEPILFPPHRSMEPSIEPSPKIPSQGPILMPSESPTALPSETLDEPTAEPSIEPSFEPVIVPSFEPVIVPSFEPVMEPSEEPVEPSIEPVMEHSASMRPKPHFIGPGDFAEVHPNFIRYRRSHA